MIEIEKKISPTPEVVERIKNDADFIGSKTMNDILFDYEDFSLIRNDIWLRKRNGKFELKVSKDKNRKNRKLDIYDELENEWEICEFLKIKSIESANFIEVMNLITERKKYKLGEFNIDLDSISSAHDDFFYRVMEIELMVNDEFETPKALEKINEVMVKYGVAAEQTRAKAMQYFYEKKRSIFEMLQQ